MTAAPWGREAGIELLDRALAYTRGALVEVTDADLGRPTPCRRWDLAALLTHMDDALDAFAEGAQGAVALRAPATADVRVASLQRKACALLGAWSAAVPDVVDVGGLPVRVGVVAHAAALEITVHGWDVAEAVGRRRPVPDDLAGELLAVAADLVTHADRPARFAAAVATDVRADPAAHLLRYLGRLPDWSSFHELSQSRDAARPGS